MACIGISDTSHFLVHLCVEITPRFYRGKKKEQSDNKNGELKASRRYRQRRNLRLQ